MSSTNKTTNYELSQFLGTDKPAWLSDYNQDMTKIDTQMKANADAATAAAGSASSANTAVGTLANLTTTDKTDLVSAVNEVDTIAGTASTTASTAATNANIALTNLAKFNLTNVQELTVTASKGTLTNNTHLYIAKDSTGSIFKLYGRIEIQNLNGISGSLTLTISNSGLTPSEAYSVASGAQIVTEYTGSYILVRPRSFNVATDGTITVSGFPINLDGSFANINLTFFPCLYFNTNFGDAPQD